MALVLIPVTQVDRVAVTADSYLFNSGNIDNYFNDTVSGCIFYNKEGKTRGREYKTSLSASQLTARLLEADNKSYVNIDITVKNGVSQDRVERINTSQIVVGKNLVEGVSSNLWVMLGSKKTKIETTHTIEEINGAESGSSSLSAS